MFGRGLRFFAIFMALLGFAGCASAPAPAPSPASSAEILQNIHDAIYVREGLDAAFIDGAWIALEAAAYLEGDTLMVPGAPLAERRGFRIVQRGGRSFITQKPQEAAAREEGGGAPAFVPAQALAEALGLRCVALSQDDVRGYALIEGPLPGIDGEAGIDPGGAGDGGGGSGEAGDPAPFPDRMASEEGVAAGGIREPGEGGNSGNDGGSGDDGAADKGNASGDAARAGASSDAAVKSAAAPMDDPAIDSNAGVPSDAPAEAASDWFLSALRAHWALLLKRGIEIDDEGKLLHSEAMAQDLLALCDPALGTNPFALRCAGYSDVLLLAPAATLFSGGEVAPGETFPEATIGIATLPLAEGRVRVCISFYPGEPLSWFADAEADSETFIGPGQGAAQALLDAMDTLEFRALSREWGRSITLRDILDESMRMNSRADIAVTGFGSAAAAAQAFVYRARQIAPSDSLAGYTFGSVRAAFTRVDTQEEPLPIFHALRQDDVLANAGAWFRPGREGAFGAQGEVSLHAPLECMRAAQNLLAADPDDVMLSLAWGLSGGEAKPRHWSDAEREALTRWVTITLPRRLGVSPAAARDDALLRKLADTGIRAEILSAHTLDAYAACTRTAEGGWVAQRDELRLSDAVAGPSQLLDDAEAVLAAIEAEEADREALEKRGRIEKEGLALDFEALEAESDELRLTAVEITDRYIDGPRGLRVGSSVSDVLAAFPGGETSLRASGQTVLYAPPQTGALRPPYGRVQASADRLSVEYALEVSGAELDFDATFETRTLRVFFDVREGAVARIRMELS